MTKILTKDMQWLYDQVPDAEGVLAQFQPFFDHGAFLAGGFLRTAITEGSAVKAFDRTHRPGDMDFFFRSPEHAERFTKKIRDDRVNLGRVSLHPYHTKQWASGPNSMMKYAYDASFTLADHSGMMQLIHKFGGTPSQILQSFDIANCKIATDGKQIYIREGWEKLEEDKLIHIDDYQDLVPWRVIKYINKGATKDKPSPYSLSDDSKVGILEHVMSKMSTGQWGKLINPLQRVKALLTHSKQLIKTEDVLFFMNKLGTVMISEAGPGSDPYDVIERRMKTKDFAVHTYEQRKKKEK